MVATGRSYSATGRFNSKPLAMRGWTRLLQDLATPGLAVDTVQRLNSKQYAAQLAASVAAGCGGEVLYLTRMVRVDTQIIHNTLMTVYLRSVHGQLHNLQRYFPILCN
jgi:hypothetical protein